MPAIVRPEVGDRVLVTNYGFRDFYEALVVARAELNPESAICDWYKYKVKLTHWLWGRTKWVESWEIRGIVRRAEVETLERMLK